MTMGVYSNKECWILVCYFRGFLGGHFQFIGRPEPRHYRISCCNIHQCWWLTGSLQLWNNFCGKTTHITNTSQTRIVSIEDAENVSIGDGSGEGSGDSFSDSRQLFAKEEVERTLFEMRLICFRFAFFFLYFVCIEVAK